MSPVKVPANLPTLVKSTFDKAKANGDVNFYPTQVAILKPVASIPVRSLLFAITLGMILTMSLLTTYSVPTSGLTITCQ